MSKQPQPKSLKERYEELALAEAMRQAAENLGIPPEVAAIYAHRFKCMAADNGDLRIEPDITELLISELKNDPLLQHTVTRSKQLRQTAAAAIGGVEAIGSADPVELMAMLDHNSEKKARFIARHGMEQYVDLAARARRKGYRG